MMSLFLLSASLVVAPIPIDPNPPITDRKSFLPQRSYASLPGKAVGILIRDPEAILAAEGRYGPPGQICFAHGLHSWRWIYLPTTGRADIGRLSVPTKDGGSETFTNLTMAVPSELPFRLTGGFALVEVEVNNGRGSSATAAFVGSTIRPLDGSKEYPLRVAAVIDEAKERHESFFAAKAKEIDAAMEAAAKKTLGTRAATGPRERETLVFVTWLPSEERLVIRFRTRIMDGAYRYVGGIPIDLGPEKIPPGPAMGGLIPPRQAPHGLRFGTKFGIEYGLQLEADRTGKLSSPRLLPIEAFTEEIPAPSGLPIGRKREGRP